MVPWQTPPQVNDLRGSRERAGHPARRRPGSWCPVSTPYSGWWKLSTRCGRTSRRNAHHRLVSGSDAGPGPGLVVAVLADPVVRVVAVQVDAVGVLAGAGGDRRRGCTTGPPTGRRPGPGSRHAATSGSARGRLVAVHGRDQHDLGAARLAEVLGPDRAAAHRVADHPRGEDGRRAARATVGGRGRRGDGVGRPGRHAGREGDERWPGRGWGRASRERASGGPFRRRRTGSPR